MSVDIQANHKYTEDMIDFFDKHFRLVSQRPTPTDPFTCITCGRQVMADKKGKCVGCAEVSSNYPAYKKDSTALTQTRILGRIAIATTDGVTMYGTKAKTPKEFIEALDLVNHQLSDAPTAAAFRASLDCKTPFMMVMFSGNSSINPTDTKLTADRRLIRLNMMHARKIAGGMFHGENKNFVFDEYNGEKVIEYVNNIKRAAEEEGTLSPKLAKLSWGDRHLLLKDNYETLFTSRHDKCKSELIALRKLLLSKRFTSDSFPEFDTPEYAVVGIVQ